MNIIGKVRIEYVVLCHDDDPDFIEVVAEHLSEGLYKEATLKSIGINVDDFINDLD